MEIPHSLPSPLPSSCSQGLSHPISGGTPLRDDITHKDGRTPVQPGPRHLSQLNELRCLGEESGEHQTQGGRSGVASWKLGRYGRLPKAFLGKPQWQKRLAQDHRNL